MKTQLRILVASDTNSP